ncbi:MAG: 4-hydroxybenzoate octaprenyltransferase [Firmicutes bacterium]|nr:4-hydroxybenzoate octaprenyltransferase [Bacillota bacterium]MDI6706420.1 UbiA-like polyprenyltransferase [Bacillota bacterium]
MVLNKIKTMGELVMFRHTIFALPFALVAMLAAARGIPPADKFFWIMVAMIGARNGANALNRIVDREIDAKNPRTAGRHIPRKEVKTWEAALLTAVCFALLAVAAYMLDPLCLKLLPVALFIFFIYNYSKRFTWLSHMILGAALGGAPVGAWIAIRGVIELPVLVMAAAVTLWVAGFDIIYATQDIEFDRKEGLHSVPARFGLDAALRIAAAFHLISVAMMFSLVYFMDMGIIYVIGMVITGGLFLYEHRIISPDNLEKVKIASYNVNELVGVVFLIFGSLDVLYRFVF